MENVPTWLTFLILAAFLVAVLFAFFAQRKVHNVPLKKRRKRLLIIAGVFLFLFLMILVISKIQGVELWQDLFTNIGFLILLLLIIVEFFYGYFRKDKKQNTTDDSKKE